MRKPVMPSAVELHEAGINFKVTKHETLPGIDFQNGVLSIPSYSVDYFSEKVLLNLMAYERLHAGTGDNITAYVIFMDNIIDTARDVALLREKGVIVNRLGSDEEIADLFNNRLSKTISSKFFIRCCIFKMQHRCHCFSSSRFFNTCCKMKICLPPTAFLGEFSPLRITAVVGCATGKEAAGRRTFLRERLILSLCFISTFCRCRSPVLLEMVLSPVAATKVLRSSFW
jgi:hypothetical protein